RVQVYPVGGAARVEQSLVGGALVDLVPPHRDGALVLLSFDQVPAPSQSLSWRSQRSMCSRGTYSSCLCASIGSPGPKFTAGTPRALNRGTSVQPNFGFTVPPTASTNSFADGRSRPGRAPGALSVTCTSYPSKKVRR